MFLFIIIGKHSIAITKHLFICNFNKRFYNLLMKKNTPDSESLKLKNFPKALATNQQNLFAYIRFMFIGSRQQIQNFNEYIFAHLRNTIDYQLNTMTLKNASKFIMTMLLLGNFHIYERFIDYLLPSFMNKLTQKYNNHVAPVWHLNQFCLQTLFVLAEWLPEDFNRPDKPSVFLRIIQKYKIQVKNFMFYTMDKIVFCYRIIKDLGINFQDKCPQCEAKGKSSICRSSRNYRRKTNFQERQLLLQKTKGNKKKDLIWNTGFQMSFQQSIQEEAIQQASRQFQKRVLDINSMFPKQQDEIDSQQKLKKKLKELQNNVNLLEGNMYTVQQQKLMNLYQKQINNKQQNMSNLMTPNKTRSKQNQIKTPLTKSSQKNLNEQSPHSCQQSHHSCQQQKHQPKLNQLVNKNVDILPFDRIILNDKVLILSAHLSIFKQYLLKISQKNGLQFRLSLLHPKRSIHLKKVNQYTLKCKASVKDKLIKLKFYFQQSKPKSGSISKQSNLYLISQIKTKNVKMSVELVNPIQNVQSFDQSKTQYILKVENITNFKPITIRIDQTRYVLSLGLSAMLKQCKQNSSSLSFKKVHQVTVNLDNNIVKSFKQLVAIFDQIGQHQKSYQILQNNDQKIDSKIQRMQTARFVYILFGKTIKLQFEQRLEQNCILVSGSLSGENNCGQYRICVINLIQQVGLCCGRKIN